MFFIANWPFSALNHRITQQNTGSTRNITIKTRTSEEVKSKKVRSYSIKIADQVIIKTSTIKV